MAAFRLGVFGLIVSRPGASMNVPWDKEALERIFDPDGAWSVGGYWRDATAARLTLAPTVHDWVAWPSGDGLAQVTTDRNAAGIAAIRALRAYGFGLREFDGLALFIAAELLDPSQAASRPFKLKPIDAGTLDGLVVDGHRYRLCVFDLFASHNFYAHEIGHLLVREHSFGYATQPYPSGVYGDPYDIMSHGTFGGRASTFSIPAAVRSFPGPYWASAGPSLSPAMEWRYGDAFPAPPPWVHVVPPLAAPASIRVHKAGRPGTTLLAVPRSDGSWLTLEYRPSNGWDRGLFDDASGNQAQAGLVLHEIRPVGTGPEPRPVGVAYKDTLPPTSRGDRDWSNAELAVRVIEETAEYVDLLVGTVLPDVRQAQLDVTVEYAEPVLIGSTMPVTVHRVGPTCGSQDYRPEWWARTAQLAVRATSAGFAEPRFLFRVNGVPLGVPLASGYMQGSAVPVHVTGHAPLTLTTTVPTSTTLTMNFVQAGNAATIDVPVGGGTFPLRIEVEVTDGTTPDPAARAAVAQDAPIETLQMILPAQVTIDQAACIRTIVDESRQLPPQEIPDDHPDWRRRIETWRPGDLVRVSRELDALVQFQTSAVVQESSLITAAARALGISTIEVLATAQRARALRRVARWSERER